MHFSRTDGSKRSPIFLLPDCTTIPRHSCDSRDTHPPHIWTSELPIHHSFSLFSPLAGPSPHCPVDRTLHTVPTPSHRSPPSAPSPYSLRTAVPASSSASPPIASFVPPPVSSAMLFPHTPTSLSPAAVGCASRCTWLPFVDASHANSCACLKSSISSDARTKLSPTCCDPSAFLPSFDTCGAFSSVPRISACYGGEEEKPSSAATLFRSLR